MPSPGNSVEGKSNIDSTSTEGSSAALACSTKDCMSSNASSVMAIPSPHATGELADSAIRGNTSENIDGNFFPCPVKGIMDISPETREGASKGSNPSEEIKPKRGRDEVFDASTRIPPSLPPPVHSKLIENGVGACQEGSEALAVARPTGVA